MTRSSLTEQDREEITRSIEQLAFFAGKPLAFEPIVTGNTNLNWRVQVDGGEEVFFVKRHGRGTGAFIDRALAHEVAIKVGALGVAPRLLFYDEPTGTEVYEFLHGYKSAVVLEVYDSHVRQGIFGIYRLVHGSGPLTRDNLWFDQFDSHVRRLAGGTVAAPGVIDDLAWQRRRVEDRVRAAGFDLCPCYNDSYVSNYMINDRREVKIVDWEYAGNNDPYWDLAMFSLETFRLAPDDIRDMLEVYEGTCRPACAARVLVYAGMAAATWGLWAFCQDATSPLPFDFGKYGDLLLMRARTIMAAPAWDQALGRI